LPDAVNALRDGQWLCKAQVLDIFLGPAEETPLSRSAWIGGLGYGGKSSTVFEMTRSGERISIWTR
jgi:ornithine cyclodeaminase